MAESPWLVPQWPAPPNILALSTKRLGGVSVPPFSSLNLARHVGDDPLAVTRNREILQSKLPKGVAVQWLQQVHGINVVNATSEPALSDLHLGPEADACWTSSAGVACAVLTADCLPILLCDRDGGYVAAVHAGWRGVLAGVVEATVAASPVDPSALMAWLGPHIGEQAFEVGEEVRDAFLANAAAFGDRNRVSECFLAAPRAGHWLANLGELATMKLNFMGVNRIYSSNSCTFAEDARYFSYRRDGDTGRMASLILINPI
ncbi:MAG: peptidoglycan editing factor PgeF [Halioglobus sp.]